MKSYDNQCEVYHIVACHIINYYITVHTIRFLLASPHKDGGVQVLHQHIAKLSHGFASAKAELSISLHTSTYPPGSEVVEVK